MTVNKSVRRPARTNGSTNRITAVKPVVRPAKAARPAPRVFEPLVAGQIWQMGEANLKVEMVGKLLLHYKLAKPNAVRTPTSIAGISTMVKYMKKNKAVLISG
jgi:hypothetical protein